jgi:ribonuclease R
MRKDGRKGQNGKGAGAPAGRRHGARGSKGQAGAAAGAGKARAASAGKPRSRSKPPPWLPEVLTAGSPVPGRRATAGAPAQSVGAAPRTPGRGTGPTSRDPYAEREAARYAEPIPSREAILALLGDEVELMTAERIAAALGLKRPSEVDALAKRLAAMVRDGQVLVNRRGGYGVARKLDLIAGTVLANRDGFGFLRRDDGGDDLFLAPATMRQVLHGDRVLASIIGLDRRGRPEGQIVEVLERRAPRLVGRYEEQAGVGLVIPDDQRIHRDILVARGEHAGARHGQVVVVEITEPPLRDRPPLGRVVAVLGEKLSASLTVRVAIENHGLPHEWPAAVLAEADAVSPTVTDADIKGRVDLRALPLVTIDGEDARDFDDAVYAEADGRGFRLVVAIADVSHYVRPGTALDDEAHQRGTSVYFPDFVVPMLPETLSNGICSLNPGVDRLAMVCDMRIDADGVVTKSRFYEAVIRSHARLTYTQVWQAIGEGDAGARAAIGAALMPRLEALHRLYQALARQRARRGAIEFESTEYTFRLAPNGEVLSMGAYERNDAHKLIEECMIAANVEAARFVLKRRLPAPLRVHARPPEDKYADLLEFLKEFRLRLPPWPDVTPKDFRQLLERVRERPDAALLESVLLRSQSLAVYLAEQPGHFGLALSEYAHFTSPIRRYPDLLLHRAIRHAIKGGRPGNFEYGLEAMAALCAHASKCERRADEAERDVDERYRCAWMEKHVGASFDGTIAGVTSFGLFVEMEPARVSGLVHVTQLPNDYYHFDATRKLMTGERRGMTFRLGDRVRVQVLRASLEDRKIDLRLVEPGGEVGGAGARGKAGLASRPAEATSRAQSRGRRR